VAVIQLIADCSSLIRMDREVRKSHTQESNSVTALYTTKDQVAHKTVTECANKLSLLYWLELGLWFGVWILVVYVVQEKRMFSKYV